MNFERNVKNERKSESYLLFDSHFLIVSGQLTLGVHKIEHIL